MKFTYQYLETMEEVRKQIQDCEGRHAQQVAYSTFHDALTQICFSCRKIRNNLNLLPVRRPVTSVSPSMNVPGEQTWEKELNKFYGAMFECGDYETLVEFVRKVRAETMAEEYRNGRKRVEALLAQQATEIIALLEKMNKQLLPGGTMKSIAYQRGQAYNLALAEAIEIMKNKYVI